MLCGESVEFTMLLHGRQTSQLSRSALYISGTSMLFIKKCNFLNSHTIWRSICLYWRHTLISLKDIRIQCRGCNVPSMQTYQSIYVRIVGDHSYRSPFSFNTCQPLVLPSPNLQSPLFMDTQEQPLEISIKWWIFCIVYIIFYHIIVLKGFKNRFLYIQ